MTLAEDLRETAERIHPPGGACIQEAGGSLIVLLGLAYCKFACPRRLGDARATLSHCSVVMIIILPAQASHQHRLVTATVCGGSLVSR